MFADLPNAADILLSVIFAEAEVLIEPKAHVVAIQPVCQQPLFDKPLLKESANGRLTTATEASQPDRGTAAAR
eukprot:CAMPEP_0179478750 /NCGR_PEP_ID=MMETSP0799-20121207/57145_1 /TAXON_ID=46947 /ORGANISM="Geminigera cryophila, Strain CCMP2564" /LENGTH=72 /DNA_ID=CAMNT_0021290003 /DNA_START=622 /DNA_END=840 /DNA_ORIENTATION=-